MYLLGSCYTTRRRHRGNISSGRHVVKIQSNKQTEGILIITDTKRAEMFIINNIKSVEFLRAHIHDTSIRDFVALSIIGLW